MSGEAVGRVLRLDLNVLAFFRSFPTLISEHEMAQLKRLHTVLSCLSRRVSVNYYIRWRDYYYSKPIYRSSAGFFSQQDEHLKMTGNVSQSATSNIVHIDLLVLTDF